MTGIGYFWSDTTLQNSIVYGYDNAGNVATCDQGWYKTTYGYDGADQLTSETGSGSHAPPSYAYTYDHNANRLTQTTNGTLIQNFAYDAHDKLTSGTLNAETDGYDANGNKTGLSFGGLFYGYTYDDEDRLIKATYPGQINTYVYNGLGLRVGMTDSAGVHTYLCDGTSPGSPVLSDGFAVYTPGLSEHRNGASLYYANDQLGNLWTVDASGKSQTFYEDTTAFGTMLSSAGTGTTPFKFGGGNGCQTDADTQMVLMGHRYYDARTGRFLSQDPAGDGDNWYAYADNSPTNEIDPGGLMSAPVPGNWSVNGGDQTDFASVIGQITGNSFSNRNTWNQVNQRWTVNVSFGVPAQPGEDGYDAFGDGSVLYRVNWAIPDWQNGQGAFAQAPSSVTNPEGAAEIGQMGDGTAETIGKPGNPRKEVLKSIKSNEKQIANHVQKIKDYIKNPYSKDNKGFLQNAKSADEVERLIQARITELEKQILKFINENDKLRSRL